MLISNRNNAYPVRNTMTLGFNFDVEVKGTAESSFNNEIILRRLAQIEENCEEAEYLRNLLKDLEPIQN